MATSSNTASSVAVYRRLLSYTLPYWPIFLLAIFGMVLFSVTDAAFAKVVQPMIDGSFVKKDPVTIIWVPILLIIIFAMRVIGNFLSSYCMSTVARNVVRDLRSRLFDHLLWLPSSYYDRTSSGGLVSKMVYDIEQVADASSNVVTILIQDTLTIIVLLIFMLYQSVELTLLLLFITPLLAMIVVYVSRRFRKLSRRIQSSMGDVSTVTEETIDANREIKIFGGQEYERGQFDTINEYNRKQFLKFSATNAISSPTIEFIVATTFAGILFYATQPAILVTLTPGKFMSFLVAMLLLMQHARRLTTINSSLQRGLAAAQSIFNFLAVPTEKNTGTKIVEHVRGNIEFKDVVFSYDSITPAVLNVDSLTIIAGQRVAFVGRSGAGKTSLVSLLPRFYDYNRGSITIDGSEIKDLTLENLRSHIALVSQHVTLFNDTIAHNLAYGSLGKASMDDVRRAAKAAHALDFIEKLPNGFDTIVGENGVMLSGGQRQRLAIARAILKDAPILILDEATSALDSESERHIQAALDELMKHRTSLIIAHRLSTIEKVDKIVVLQEGHIVEVGSHVELLSHGGTYAHLHRLQFSGKQITPSE